MMQLASGRVWGRAGWEGEGRMGDRGRLGGNRGWERSSGWEEGRHGGITCYCVTVGVGRGCKGLLKGDGRVRVLVKDRLREG